MYDTRKTPARLQAYRAAGTRSEALSLSRLRTGAKRPGAASGRPLFWVHAMQCLRNCLIILILVAAVPALARQDPPSRVESLSSAPAAAIFSGEDT